MNRSAERFSLNFHYVQVRGVERAEVYVHDFRVQFKVEKPRLGCQA
jgi:hypothetical protein